MGQYCHTIFWLDGWLVDVKSVVSILLDILSWYSIIVGCIYACIILEKLTDWLIDFSKIYAIYIYAIIYIYMWCDICDYAHILDVCNNNCDTQFLDTITHSLLLYCLFTLFHTHTYTTKTVCIWLLSFFFTWTIFLYTIYYIYILFQTLCLWICCIIIIILSSVQYILLLCISMCVCVCLWKLFVTIIIIIIKLTTVKWSKVKYIPCIIIIIF